MGKSKNAVAGGFAQELLQPGLYKRSQGRITRQVTFVAIALIVAVGVWRLNEQLRGHSPAVAWGIPLALLAAGTWIGYRIVNWPKFADFLIAVEAEMNKVSWPTRAELFRSSLVVIVTIFLLGAILFVYDYVWVLFFEFIGVR